MRHENVHKCKRTSVHLLLIFIANQLLTFCIIKKKLLKIIFLKKQNLNFKNIPKLFLNR